MKPRISRLSLPLALCLVMSGLALTSVSGEEAKKVEQTESPATQGASTAAATSGGFQSDSGSGCLADAAAIEDLQHRREELESRQKDLAAKEAELDAREKALNEEIRKLEQIRDDIAKIDVARKKEGEQNVAKLVETMEGMSPKSAAQLLVALDDSLAVAVISKVSTQRLSKIMNVLEPGRASRLTELLAGVVRARNQSASADAGAKQSPRFAANSPSAKAAASIGAAATTPKREGGEKNDGINQQQQSNAGDTKRGAERGPSAEKGKGTGAGQN